MVCQASKGVVSRNSFVTAGSVSDWPQAMKKAASQGGSLPTETPLFRSETGIVIAVVASQAGFEPATRCLEGSRSVHLSYWDLLFVDEQMAELI